MTLGLIAAWVGPLATGYLLARRGLPPIASVPLRRMICGGAAVAGMSGTICGLYAATDDTNAPPRQLVALG